MSLAISAVVVMAAVAAGEGQAEADDVPGEAGVSRRGDVASFSSFPNPSFIGVNVIVLDRARRTTTTSGEDVCARGDGRT